MTAPHWSLPVGVPCRVCSTRIDGWAEDLRNGEMIALPCCHGEHDSGDADGRRKVRFGEYVPPRAAARGHGRVAGWPLWLRIALWLTLASDGCWHFAWMFRDGLTGGEVIVHFVHGVASFAFGFAALTDDKEH